jgi:D-alanine-D-alanine ligase
METIAVIFGGRSAEHDVSIVTAIASVMKPLELTRKYRIEAVYITKDGAWYWDERLKDINLFTSGKINDLTHKAQPASVQFDGGMTLVKASGLAGRKTMRKIDMVFPAMHGTYGEDGALMGLLDMAGVPYVGCGVSASAIAMDKVLAKQVAQSAGIPVTKFLVFTRGELERDPAKVLRRVKEMLAYPVFIKPAHLGSSIGISKASTDTALQNGLEVAAHYDDKILVEEAVSNLIEVTLPVMGNDRPVAALLERPLTKPDDFFDFESKYLHGGKKGKGGAKAGKGAHGAQGYSQLPAELLTSLYTRAEAVGLEVYRTLGCSGTARVDMLIDSKAETIYFNEVNPLPGSLYAHNWNAAGISNVELVERLLQLARERFRERSSLTTSFSTNYLQQF